jgi:hypothetical protein
MVEFSQMSVWAQEIIREHWTGHTNHIDWRCDFHRIAERKAVPRWGDESLPTAEDNPVSRRVFFGAPGGPHFGDSAE